jgi:hypothetical protein
VLERVSHQVGDDRVQIYKVRCFETPTMFATLPSGLIPHIDQRSALHSIQLH